MKKILLGTILLIAGVVFYSCSKDSSSPATTTVADDKQNITKTFNDFYGCLNTLDDGDLSNFLLYSLFNNTAQTYNDSYLNALKVQFELQYGKIILNDKLQFANRTGVYTWSQTANSWTKVSNSSVIKLIFPSRTTNPALDSELTLNSYNDSSVTYTTKTYWLPTGASLTLKRNNNTVFTADISNVSFVIGTNFSMPISADITILTAPFTHTFTWRRNTPTDFSLTYSSSSTAGCGTSLTANVKLNDSDYANITSAKDDLKLVSGSVTSGSLTINYAVNVLGLSVYTDPSDAQVNANTDAEVFYNGTKIGDLDYRTINNKVEIFIIYSDGTSENVETYVSDFEQTVRNIFDAYL